MQSVFWNTLKFALPPSSGQVACDAEKWNQYMQNPLPGHEGLLRRPTVVAAIRWPSAALLVLDFWAIKSTAGRAAFVKLRNWDETCRISWKKLFVHESIWSKLLHLCWFQGQIGSSEIQHHLGARSFLPIWQSNWPPTQRNPLAPPKLCLAGDDVAMTPEELGSHGSQSRWSQWRRKRWDELLLPIYPGKFPGNTVSNLSFTDLAQGFDCHAWNLNYSEVLPTTWFSSWRKCQYRITNTQGTKNQGILFHYGGRMSRQHAISNPLPVELENKNSASSAKTEVCTRQPILSDMPFHLNAVASHSFKRNQIQRLFAEWGESGVMMSTCWLKSQPWETIEIADHSPSCWIWLDWYAWYAAFSLVVWSTSC